MMIIQKNSAVTLQIEMRDSDGNALTDDEHHMSYLHGGFGNLFPKLEEALEGKQVGEECQLSLDPEDAFGDYDSELLRVEARAQFPETLEVGMQFEGVPSSAEDEEPSDEALAALIYTVTDIADGKVVLDGNHPLAGERIWVKARVSEIRPATEDEVAHGHVHGAHGVTHAHH
jgi:FKBP-type peptidyl-prolyl cis-trans isomerase SlyD